MTREVLRYVDQTEAAKRALDRAIAELDERWSAYESDRSPATSAAYRAKAREVGLRFAMHRIAAARCEKALAVLQGAPA